MDKSLAGAGQVWNGEKFREQMKEIFIITFDCTRSLDEVARKFYRFEPPAVLEEQKQKQTTWIRLKK